MPINANSPTQLVLSVFLSTLPQSPLRRLLFADDVLPRELVVSKSVEHPTLRFSFVFPKGDQYRAVWKVGTEDITYELRKASSRKGRPIAADSWYLTLRTQLSIGEKPYPLYKKDWEAYLRKGLPDLEMWKDYPEHDDENHDADSQPVPEGPLL